MNIIGLIAEYNPFHNGHLYQINKIKELFPDSILIVLISSSFSQRGETIILNKWERTEIALKNKADIVVELPYPFSTQSADIFAKGSIQILQSLNIDTLVFGIQNSSFEDIKKVAKVQINNKVFESKVKEYIDNKYSYKTAINKAIKDLTEIELASPNDILSVSYIKEILKQNKNINAYPIKRTSDYLDLKSNKSIVSASNIREKILNNKSIKKYVPKDTYKYLKDKTYDSHLYFKLLKYKLISENDLSKYVTVDEGIENRIIKFLNNSNSLEELVNNVTGKRYTNNKIRRSLCHIINNYTKILNNDFKNIEYIRILGFNQNGKLYLNKIKNETSIPILTNYKKGYKMFEYEIKITHIYDILMNSNIANLEYTNKPIIFNENQ